MFFLTPSDVPQNVRSWIDNLWYQQTVVHEYVHVPTMRDLDKVRYAHVGNAPQWLTEGIAEYISIFRTTNEILQKYMIPGNSAQSDIDGQMLIALNSKEVYFQTTSVYCWSPYVVKYMYETYGPEKVHLLFNTAADYFLDALGRGLSVSPHQFEEDWVKWIYHEFNMSIPSQYLKDDELLASLEGLQQNYTDLSQLHQQLQTEFKQLNSTYATLLTNYQTLQTNNTSLQTNYNSLKSLYGNIQSNYNILQTNSETTKLVLGTLQANNSALQTSYNDLQIDHQQL
jgi:hypothetical protein